MRSALLLATFFVFAQSANADTLKCWDTFSKKGSPPALTALIEDNSVISNIVLTTRTEQGFECRELVDGTAVSGAEITTGRSPYKGNQQFRIEGIKLILPLSLDNQSLLDAQETGIGKGMGSGENGVIIGNVETDDWGSGTHYSTRLRCRSYAY